MNKKTLFLAIITLFAGSTFVPAQCDIKEEVKKTFNYVKKHPIKSTLIALYGAYGAYNIAIEALSAGILLGLINSNHPCSNLSYMNYCKINKNLRTAAIMNIPVLIPIANALNLFLPATIAYTLLKTN